MTCPAPVITNAERRDLEWYYSVGLAHFERSVFGAALDRQESQELSKEAKAEARQSRPLTAQPTAEVRSSHVHEPDEDILIRYGDISRRLAKCTPLAREVLSSYYGDLGAVFSVRALMREASLFPYVKAGQVHLRRILASKSGFNLSLRDRLISDIITSGYKDRRDARYTEANDQARSLLAQAESQYAATGDLDK